MCATWPEVYVRKHFNDVHGSTAYAYDVNILGENINTTEALIEACRGVGLT
jgi:hypothetical protein